MPEIVGIARFDRREHSQERESKSHFSTASTNVAWPAPSLPVLPPDSHGKNTREHVDPCFGELLARLAVEFEHLKHATAVIARPNSLPGNHATPNELWFAKPTVDFGPTSSD